MQEIVANAFWWDPYGARWGRGAHWPLIFGIGRARYRSKQMLEKRRKKKIAKRWQWQDTSSASWRTRSTGKRTSGGRDSRQPWRPGWWGVADGKWQAERANRWGGDGWHTWSGDAAWGAAEHWDGLDDDAGDSEMPNAQPDDAWDAAEHWDADAPDASDDHPQGWA